jgi:hypothetical protein
VNVTNVHNVYNRTVINNHTNVNRVSFNGGRGGVNARPTSAEMAANRDHHIGATSAQTQHEHAASSDRGQLASANHGRPSVTATARPGEFSGHGAVAANTNHNSNVARSSSNATRNSNNAAQARNSGRSNTFARSQNNTNRTVTRSENNSTHVQQNNARPSEPRSSNSRASNSRSSNPRPSNTRSFNAPQHNNATRQQSSPAYRQNTSHAAPSHQSRPPAPQPHQNSNRPPSSPGRSAAPSQPHNNGGSHASNGGGGNNHEHR